jgi:tensin
LIPGFGDVNEALSYIAKCKQTNPENLIIPSQKRYVQYMQNMMDSVRPSQQPLLLKRIIMSQAPRVSELLKDTLAFGANKAISLIAFQS